MLEHHRAFSWALPNWFCPLLGTRWVLALSGHCCRVTVLHCWASGGHGHSQDNGLDDTLISPC
jgi:hypothetical protein